MSFGSVRSTIRNTTQVYRKYPSRSYMRVVPPLVRDCHRQPSDPVPGAEQEIQIRIGPGPSTARRTTAASAAASAAPDAACTPRRGVVGDEVCAGKPWNPGGDWVFLVYNCFRLRRYACFTIR